MIFLPLAILLGIAIFQLPSLDRRDPFSWAVILGVSSIACGLLARLVYLRWPNPARLLWRLQFVILGGAGLMALWWLVQRGG